MFNISYEIIIKAKYIDKNVLEPAILDYSGLVASRWC